MAAAALLAGVGMVVLPAGASADVEAILTADNAYSFGWGTSTTILPNNYYGPVINSLDSAGKYNNKTFVGCPAVNVTKAVPNNLDGVERFVVSSGSIPSSGGYFYLIADSDDAVQQGVLGTFQNLQGNGLIVPTGHADWEVCATGDNYLDFSNSQTTPAYAPLPTINAAIVECNKNAGAPTTTSGGWVNATAGHAPGNAPASLGRLFPSDPNTTRNGPSNPPRGALNPYSSIDCIAPSAAWMWFNADPSNVVNPLTTKPTIPAGLDNHKEFLIFRLPVQTVVDDDPCPSIEVTIIGDVECKSGLSGPSGCYEVHVRVRNVGTSTLTHVTFRPAKGTDVVVQRTIAPGASANIILTLCTPLSGVGTWMDVSAVSETGDICCSERVNLELPRCELDPCMNIPSITAVECNPSGLPGAFTVELKLSPSAAGTLFALQPDDPQVTISPSAYDLGLAGGTYGPKFTIEDPSLPKSSPRIYCMKLLMLPNVSEAAPFDLESECCTRTVCFPVPFCGLPTPTPNPVPLGADQSLADGPSGG